MRLGYVYIYLSNEEDPASPVDVFFDDFKITQTHSPVVQKGAERLEIIQWIILAKSQDVGGLPFGLSFNSYSRAAITAQNFMFNAGSEVEKMTDWYSTPFRKYDPSLGRFHGVDALAELNSTVGPSSFAHNNPIMFNDPTGLDDNDGDEENGGGGGGEGSITFQNSFIPNTPWYGYDMRGYDNIASATRGHGGNNGWASAGRFGSLYNTAFRSFSPNAAQHLEIKKNRLRAENGLTPELMNAFIHVALTYHDGGQYNRTSTEPFVFFDNESSGITLAALAAWETSLSNALGEGNLSNLMSLAGLSTYTGTAGSGVRLLSKVVVTPLYAASKYGTFYKQAGYGYANRTSYGQKLGLNGVVSGFGGIKYDVGIIWDDRGKWAIYSSPGVAAGADYSLGISAGFIYPTDYKKGFNVTDYRGNGVSDNLGILMYDVSSGGDGITDYGVNYNETEFGVSLGNPWAGYTRQYSNTKLLWGNY